MIINVEKIKSQKNSKISLDVRANLNEKNYQEEGISFVDELSLIGTLENTGTLLTIDAIAKAKVELECGRCLEKFIFEVETPFFESYTNKPEIATNDLEDEIHLFSGDEINVSEDVFRVIFMELPMQPVCSESCKGLCSSCGANLNKEECSCDKEVIDIRLEKLKYLLNSMEKGVE